MPTRTDETQAIARLADGLWAIDLPQKVGGVELGARSTIARLEAGGLVLISPGPFREEHVQAIRELGTVEAIVAPNTFHHLYLSPAKEHFTGARVYLAPGLREKVPGLPEGEVLGDEAPIRWQGALEPKVIRGTRLNEVVFFHPPSRTLILTDMAFHIRKGGFFTRLAMTLNGGFGKFGPTRVLRTTFVDEKEVKTSIAALLDWDFDRVIVAHGDIVETGGRERLREAYRLGR